MKRRVEVLFSPRGEVSADSVKLKAYKKIPYLNMLKISGMYKGCYFHGTSDDEIREQRYNKAIYTEPREGWGEYRKVYESQPELDFGE